MQSRLFILSVLLAILVLLNVEARADESSALASPRLIPDKQVLDSIEYTGESLIAGFMTAAFGGDIPRGIRGLPTVLYADGKFRSPHLNFPSLQTDRLKAEYPWLHEYIYREKGEPKYNAINKWNSPITVAIGYPNNLNPFIEDNNTPLPSFGGIEGNYPLSATIYCCATETDEKIQKRVAEDIKFFLPAIADMSGLSAKFMPREKETKDSYANVRIIIETGGKPDFATMGVSQRQKLADKGWQDRDGEQGTGPAHETFRRYIGMHSSIRRYLLKGAVNFTPDFPYAVDGFLLPNEKNEIERAFCFISDKLSDQQLKAAVGECLLRVLGLPELSGPIPTKEYYRFLSINLNPQPNVHPFLKIPESYSEYDQFMARLLYAPNIKPGASYNEVLRYLSGSKN